MFPSSETDFLRNRNMEPLPINTFDPFPLAKTPPSQIDNTFCSKSQTDSPWLDSKRYGESQTPMSFQQEKTQATMYSEQDVFGDSFRTASNTTGSAPIDSPGTTEPLPLRNSGMVEGIPQNSMAMAPSPATQAIEPNPNLSQCYQGTISQEMSAPQCSSQLKHPGAPRSWQTIHQVVPSATSFFTLSSSPTELTPNVPSRQRDNGSQNGGRATIAKPPPSKQSSEGYVNKQRDSTTVPRQKVSPVCFRTHQNDNWLGRFKELLEFRLRYGHCLVPNHFQENLPLAEWVKRQRYQYKLKRLGQRSSMSADRIADLEKLGFVWNSHDQVWEERLRDLVDFKRLHGHCNVPSKYANNPQLAIWVKRQRRQYRFMVEGETSTMNPYRIDKMNEIAFPWSGRKPNVASSPTVRHATA